MVGERAYLGSAAIRSIAGRVTIEKVRKQFVNKLSQIEARSTRRASVPCSTDQSAARHIVRLQLLTLAWMFIECGVALFSAYRAHSPALLAFGSDSFVELLSASVVLFQFLPSFALSPERAARIAGVLLFVLAAVVCLESIAALAKGVQPETSWTGIAVTAAALAIMPLLARAKRKAARQTGNRALQADAVQSATCAYLAALTAAGLIMNAMFHIRWVDPLAALLAVPILCIEGRRALRGNPCGCCS
jgi:divalent metal cation (Fe/Co/Zn/Cd) transporter